MNVRRSLAITLSALLSAAAFAHAPVASAKDGETAKDGGVCSKDARVRLRVSPSDTTYRLDIVGVVFSDDADVWSWRMVHNDDVSFRGEVQAKDADRSFRISRGMIDLGGTDNIIFRAVNQTTGEVCRGEVDY